MTNTPAVQQNALTDLTVRNMYNEEMLTKLIKSQALPKHIKTIEDAVAIRQMGIDLGLSFMQAAHMLFPTNGKLALTAQAMTALMLQKGIAIQTVKDFAPHEITVIGASGEPMTVKTYATIIKFTRHFKDVGNVTEECVFTWRDAQLAGLTSKETWKSYPKAMMWARCVSLGGKRIAADLFHGIAYIIEELEDGKAPVIVDDSGIPESIQSNMEILQAILKNEPELIQTIIKDVSSIQEAQEVPAPEQEQQDDTKQTL